MKLMATQRSSIILHRKIVPQARFKNTRIHKNNGLLVFVLLNRAFGTIFCRKLFIASLSGVFCGYPSLLTANENVKAELGAESVWVGEGVPLEITLRAPGPFSGTALFELPELPRTFIIKQGGPTVGSETRAGKTWMTQRHEFRIYTQESGTLELPAFRVLFEAKKDFISEAQPFEGTTPPFQFKSKRPPGTEQTHVVLAAQNMQIEQTWSSLPGQSMNAGDVVERRITRRAAQTTGMMFPDLILSAPDGVRIYSSPPIINDRTERGESLAERIDILKYQFSAGGKFQLPAIEFTWWDPTTEQLKTKTLDGAEFEIKILSAESISRPGYSWLWGLAVVPLLWILKIIVSRARNNLHQPKRLAAKAVILACRQNRPAEAYAALIEWIRISDPESGFTMEEALRQTLDGKVAGEWRTLSKSLYSNSTKSWKGAALETAFTTAGRNRRKQKRRTVTAHALPNLNPT